MRGALIDKARVLRIVLAMVIACLAMPLQLSKAAEMQAALSGQANSAVAYLCAHDSEGNPTGETAQHTGCEHCLTCGGAALIVEPQPGGAASAVPAFVLLRASESFAPARLAPERPLHGGGTSWASRAPPVRAAA